MKILIVGMARSIHTARWINQFNDSTWDVHLFPSFDNGASHQILNHATVHHSFYSKEDNSKHAVILKGVSVPSKKVAALCRKLLKRYVPLYRKYQLKRLIKKLKPDIIHSLGVDTGSYLVNSVKESYPETFPAWVVSNWGNDLYFFGRLSTYREKMLSVLKSCKNFSCECRRDELLAKNEYGFTGTVFPYIQCGGGWDLKSLAPLRSEIPTSQRKIILVKGYQHLMGRALVAFRALERCKDILQNYEIVVFGPDPETEIRLLSEWLSLATSIPVTVIGQTNDYQKIITLQAKARIFIGLSISDGVSNSFLESIIMGSFPIQSVSSNTGEWLEEGVSGISVPPEDPEVVEQAIRRALLDDNLVDTAAKINWKVAESRLSSEIMKNKAIKMYSAVVAQNSTATH